MANPLTVGQALHAIREKAAVLRFINDSAEPTSTRDPAELTTLGTMCADIEVLSWRIRAALTPESLKLPLP